MQGSGLIDTSNYNSNLFTTGGCTFVATDTDDNGTILNPNGEIAIKGAGYTIDTYKADGITIDSYGDFASVEYGTDGKITSATSSANSQFGAQSWS